MAMAGHDGCMKLARSLPSRLSLARGSVQTKAKIDRTKSRVGIFTRRPGPRAPTVHTHTTCRYTCKARRRRSGGMRRPAAGRRGSAGGPTLSGGEPRAPEALWQTRRVGGKLRPAWRVGPVRVASGQRRRLGRQVPTRFGKGSQSPPCEGAATVAGSRRTRSRAASGRGGHPRRGSTCV